MTSTVKAIAAPTSRLRARSGGGPAATWAAVGEDGLVPSWVHMSARSIDLANIRVCRQAPCVGPGRGGDAAREVGGTTSRAEARSSACRTRNRLGSLVTDLLGRTGYERSPLVTDVGPLTLGNRRLGRLRSPAAKRQREFRLHRRRFLPLGDRQLQPC